ncbi:hypothetical protein LPB72_05305 [Hydrogenophaga crassostreae]|uniref:Uncharacterized protein n=1 Tax=Hydrogenophaga crassostreae TaxID=1763535 RepID=A0A167INP4_9BURK|nr:hypothetical protein [Hydrogenophaga crassostreae]AOW14642.1 hypothetical protein LPB072_19245 [Hydrogenophaga crassostreae]OAD43261.1 hypothetical protein LPB72_05305 [Hydrogenophaga crassostreae]
MVSTFDCPRSDRLTGSRLPASLASTPHPEDSLEALLAGVQRVSQMGSLPLGCGLERGHTGWASTAWARNMASLAWLLEHRVMQLDTVADSPKHGPECLRLRALVAMIWWQGYCPAMLTTWGVREVEALCKRHGSWLEGFGEQVQAFPPLLACGPQRAIRDWMEAARIAEGHVLRRILPSGAVAPGSLSTVGARSLFSTLVADAQELGLVDAAFVLNFPSENPICPLGIATFVSDASRLRKVAALKTKVPSRNPSWVVEAQGRNQAHNARQRAMGASAR